MDASSINFIFSIIVLIFSVVVHELSHGIAADRLGDPTPSMQGRLTLNPLKHLDLIGSFLLPVLTYNVGGFIFGWAKPVEWNPYNVANRRWGELIIAAAGPVSNLILALIFGLVYQFGASIGIPESAISLSAIIVLVNVSLAIFNLMPIPPLDGSKIIFSILPLRFAHIRESVEQYGLIIFVVFILLAGSIISPLVRFVAGLFLGL